MHTGLGILLMKMLYVFDKLPLKEKWRREKIYRLEVLAAQSKGYILRYRPDLMGDIDYSENWIGAFTVNMWEFL